MTTIIPDQQQPLPRRSTPGMDTRAVKAAAGVLLAARQRACQTPTGQAIALHDAGLLNSPEHAAEVEQMRQRLAAAPTGLNPEQREAIAANLADAKPATDHLLFEMAQQIRDRREHDHPAAADWDWYCLNASGWLGDKAPTVLRRLLDAEARLATLEARLAEYERPADEDPIAYALTDAANELRSCCAGPACTCTPLTPQDDEYIPPNDDAPALQLPAIAVTCPYCAAEPGDLCTSHSGTRPRRRDVHQARTLALAAKEA